MTKVYKNDVGIALSVATGVTLTGATTTQLKVKKPSGATAVWPAAIDGINPQQLNYTTTTGDLNEAGRYFIQAFIQTGGQTLFGETAEIDIYGAYQ